MDGFENYVRRNMRRVWVRTCTEKEKERMGGERELENVQQHRYGMAAESAWIARTETRPARPRTAGVAAWQLHPRGLDAHGIRTRTQFAPSANATRNGTWYLVPGTLDSGAGADAVCARARQYEVSALRTRREWEQSRARVGDGERWERGCGCGGEGVRGRRTRRRRRGARA
ncbi:hypothetical protein C8F04DRAFT_1291620 [Mycena alexandri]|uniref:Uncharacterized protein n=1 Tax=Mycena alexandri TaxID=1745969 RepID=A0AAD6SHJ9_9AGAR|nr:hypothetical protein C8F04DRAFT_1291620 [Mycena alexandri]